MILTFVHFPADRGNLLKSFKDIEDMIPNARVDESSIELDLFRLSLFVSPLKL